MFVDRYHAEDKTSCRSRSNFLIYLNTALVQWLSKKQCTVETSVCGTEFVTMKQGIDALRGLRYKLGMMGIPLSSPSYIYGDNKQVVHNTSKQESGLRKKSSSVYSHALHESVVMGESLVGHIPSKQNVTDLMTKFCYGKTRKYLISNILYDIYDNH